MATQVETAIERRRAAEETMTKMMGARLHKKSDEKRAFAGLSKELKELIIEKVYSYYLPGKVQSGHLHKPRSSGPLISRRFVSSTRNGMKSPCASYTEMLPLIWVAPWTIVSLRSSVQRISVSSMSNSSGYISPALLIDVTKSNKLTSLRA